MSHKLDPLALAFALAALAGPDHLRASAEPAGAPAPVVRVAPRWSTEFRALLERHDRSVGTFPEGSTLRLSRGSGEGKARRAFQAEVALPAKIRVSVIDAGREYGEGFNGFFAWELWEEGKPASVVGGEPENALRRASLWLAGLRPFLDMQALGVLIEDGGSETVAGRSYRVVCGSLPGGYTRRWYLDPASGRAMRQRDVRPLHPGEKIRRIETLMDEWTTVGPLSVARLNREVDLDTGEVLSEDRWTEIVIVPIDPARFDPPATLGGAPPGH